MSLLPRYSGEQKDMKAVVNVIGVLLAAAILAGIGFAIFGFQLGG